MSVLSYQGGWGCLCHYVTRSFLPYSCAVPFFLLPDEGIKLPSGRPFSVTSEWLGIRPGLWDVLLRQRMALLLLIILFRILFRPYRKDKKKREWISLRQSDNPSLFTCYEESFKYWKSSYMKIVPCDKVAFWWDGKGRNLFPLYWSKAHYSLSQLPKAELYGFLEEEDHATYRKLCAFVGEYNYPIHCKDVVHVKSRDHRKHCQGKSRFDL